MGQKEADKLRALIQKRAALLGKLKKAKGIKKQTLEIELASTNSAIRQLDEKQQ